MCSPDTVTQLHLHTLETLCNELVSGRGVVLADGELFRFDADETRAALGWYLDHRDEWDRNVRTADLDERADALAVAPPTFPPSIPAEGGAHRGMLHLKRMRVRRFAGIHHYGTTEEPPEEFEFEFDRPLTLIEGLNGSGKSSLLSAITWCLTGHVYRSQRLPEEIDGASAVLASVDAEGEGAPLTKELLAITPLPKADLLRSLGANPLTLDTRVTLEFVGDSGAIAGAITRSVTRGRRGGIRIEEPDFTVLGLDPVGRSIGTLMAGSVPYIQLGKTCRLGGAVAALTGLRGLQDLAHHARRSRARYERELPGKRQQEIADLDETYLTARHELQDLLAEHHHVAPTTSVPETPTEEDMEVALGRCAKELEEKEAQAFEASRSILGTDFDPTDRGSRDDLRQNVGPAIGQVGGDRIRRLPSAQRLHDLKSVGEADVAAAEELIAELAGEAGTLAKLALNESVHARLRLYARVATWLKEQPDVPEGVEQCPVCLTALAGKMDPVTGKPVAAHIGKFLASESHYIELTLTDWQERARQRLATGVCATLQAALQSELPATPADLISTALCDELFEDDSFSGSLAPLRERVRCLCADVIGRLPAFAEPKAPQLPDCFTSGPRSLRDAFTRLTRAIAFGRWRRENAEACAEAFQAVIGDVPSEAASSEPAADTAPLRSLLGELRQVIQDTTPLAEARAKMDRLTKTIAERRKREERIRLYARAATAMRDLQLLGTLVEQQVTALTEKLSAATAEWKKRFYKSAYSAAPEIVSTSIGRDGSLSIEAEAEGTRIDASHVSNASDLRATLLAFLIAFWQHLLEERGGLSLLLIDDLQELFDPPNRRRIANAVAKVVAAGGRVIATTNDRRFGRQVDMAATEELGGDEFVHLCIHPLNPSRQHVDLGPFIEEVERKQHQFERDVDNEQTARDYVNALRIYIEHHMLDFFCDHDAGLPRDPTVADLVRALCARAARGVEPFHSQAFQELASMPELGPGSEFLRLMNESHHGNAHLVMPTDVQGVQDACVRVRKLIRKAYGDYELWLQRDAAPPAPAMPPLPRAMATPAFDVPVFENVAALVTGASAGDALASLERFSGTSLDHHAAYLINTHNLGFSCPNHSRVIVGVSAEDAPDRSLVVALRSGGVLARRLLRDEKRPGVVTLASDAEDPRTRPPSEVLSTAEVRLLKIVCVLFDDQAHYPRPTQEAALVDIPRALSKIECACEVVGESAVPLALPGQRLLCGGCLASGQLDIAEGSRVVIVVSGSAGEEVLFKRVGKALAGARHMRIFESVGALGESIVVRTEQCDGAFADAPLLVSARQVLGVLYEI